MSHLEIKSVNRTNVTETVINNLLNEIIVQSLKPGDALLSEAELVEAFGVSKPVIREALRALSAMGVLELQQGRVATVRSPTSEPLENFIRFVLRDTKSGLREAVEVRRGLEMSIVELAAERINSHQIDLLEIAFERMEEQKGSGDIEDWVEADLEFHRILAESAGNHLMYFIVQAIIGVFRESITQTTLAVRKTRNVQATLSRHRKILDAVRDGDKDKAIATMQAHFDVSRQIVSNIEDNKTVKD